MSDLLIEKDKKTEWLQKYGTPNALELLGVQVDDLHNKAVQNRLLSKEKQEMNGTTDMVDPLDSLTETQTGQTAEGFDDLSGLADDLVQNKSVETVTETPVAEVAETAEAQDDETEEVSTPVSNKNVSEETEHRELIDTLIVEIVNPMVEELKEVRKEIEAVRKEKAEATAAQEALQKQLDTLQKELQIQGLQLKEETLPQASTAAMLKNYIKEQLNQGTDNKTFGKEVSNDDPILAKKPVENKTKEQQSGVFGGFLEGN